MVTSSTSSDALAMQAALLVASLGRAQSFNSREIAKLDLLIRNAQAQGHRRADYNARDRAVYRLGGAFEPADALGLDDVQLTGLLTLGGVGVILLAKAAIGNPEASVAGLLRIVFLSKAGSLLRAHGVYCRWRWLRTLYLQETEAFLATKKGQDRKAHWRFEKPNKNQIYLAAEISRLLQIIAPQFKNRGAAFDWIKDRAGNPRFWQPPPAIDVDQLGALLP